MSENQQNDKRVEHRYLTVFPDLTTVENDLIRLLNDFNNTKLKKYADREQHDAVFKKMDAIRDKQERIAREHFLQDSRANERKNNEREDQKTQAVRDIDDLTSQLDELSKSIQDLQPAH